MVFWLYLHFCFSRANGLLRCCPTGRERGDIAPALGGGQVAVSDVGEGNPRAIWRSLMRIRSAVGDDDRVTTTFAECERALSTAGMGDNAI